MHFSLCVNEVSMLVILMSVYRGILSLAWCPSDSDLLLSCGKDNRILCWNANTDSRVGEVSLTLSLCFVLSTIVCLR